ARGLVIACQNLVVPKPFDCRDWQHIAKAGLCDSSRDPVQHAPAFVAHPDDAGRCRYVTSDRTIRICGAVDDDIVRAERSERDEHRGGAAIEPSAKGDVMRWIVD